GQTMQVLLPDLISMYLFLQRPFEPEVKSFIESTLKPGMTFFDIGAHIGYFTLTAVNIVKQDGSIVSFEPMPNLYKILESNCKPFPNITLEQLAINDGSSSQITLNYYGARLAGSTTAHTIRMLESQRQTLPEPQQHLASATSIDSYVAQTGYIPDLIKLDIEGGEMDALRGAQDTIERYSPCIIMEVGDIGRNRDNCTSACLEFLKALGYKSYEFDRKDRRIKPHNIREAYNENGNLLCISRS
ncbi:hypothetical protein A3K72_04305, partial [Candidatus Woesearchaeota archaeon RBG_13_36_6]